MKTRSLLAGFALVATSSAGLAYCPGLDPAMPGYRPDFYSVKQEFLRSKFVVEATLEHETWLGENGKPKPIRPPFYLGADRPSSGIFDPYAGAYFDIRVTKSFKGNAPKRLRLFSENSTARFILHRGKSYILFVTPDAFDPPINRALTVDNCGNSNAASQRTLVARVARLSTR